MILLPNMSNLDELITMNVASDYKNTVKENISDISCLQEKMKLDIKNDHVIIPSLKMEEGVKNDHADNNRDYEYELHKGNSPERIKLEACVESSTNLLDGNQVDPLLVSYCDLENHKKEYSCTGNIKEEFKSQVPEEFKYQNIKCSIDIKEHKIESSSSNDQTSVSSIYEDSIPSYSSTKRDAVPLEEDHKAFLFKKHLRLHSASNLFTSELHNNEDQEVNKMKLLVQSTKSIGPINRMPEETKDHFDDCHETASSIKKSKCQSEALNKGIKKYDCKQCHKIFSSTLSVETHINRVHKRIINYECNHCHETFSSQLNLKIHIDSMHRGNNYQCSKCYKMFSSALLIQSHICSVHKRIKKYECDDCHEMFPFHSHARRHIECVHKIIKMYECKECHKMFSSANSLKKHTYFNSEPREIKHFNCNECHKTFAYELNLKNHIDSVHKQLKEYQCRYCHKIYSSVYSAKRHIDSIHKGIKNYNCNLCKKKFTYISQLKIHINDVHKEIKGYECKECCKSFSEFGN